MCRCCLDDTNNEIYEFTSEFALEDNTFLEIRKCFESTLNLTITEVKLAKLRSFNQLLTINFRTRSNSPAFAVFVLSSCVIHIFFRIKTRNHSASSDKPLKTSS